MKYIWIATALLLVSCNNKPAQQAEKLPAGNGTSISLTEAQYKNAGIETGLATQKEITSVIKVTGKIDVPPQNMVSVSFPLGGYLKKTSLLPGMHIAKGEMIAVLEDPQYIQLQQDYLTALARQTYLEGEYRRQKDLNDSKASSDKVFQQAEAEYKSNHIAMNALAQKLQLIGINPARLSENNISRTVSVYAPIDGYVSSVNVNVGKYVTPSDVLFELVNPSDIHLALTVFEKDINALYIGQKLAAYTNANPAKKYPCEVILIGKDVSAERAIQVHCHFEQYDQSLVPGMYMNAEIEARNATAFVVPEDAVVRYASKQYLFILAKNNSFQLQEVTTGASENGMIAITNAAGIDLATQPVVTKRAYTLLMKLKNTAE